MLAMKAQFWPLKYDNDLTGLIYYSFWHFDITSSQSQLRHCFQTLRPHRTRTLNLKDFFPASVGTSVHLDFSSSAYICENK
jgi:hypothetical protein